MNNNTNCSIKNEEIFLPKIRNDCDNKSPQPLKLNIINDKLPQPLKLNIVNNISPKPLKLNIIDNKQPSPLKLNIVNNISPKSLKLNIDSNPKCNTQQIELDSLSYNNSNNINKIDFSEYEENILFINSIVDEARKFLVSVPEMKKMIPPIRIFGKYSKYNYEVFVNKSREKFGLIFDYSLTNPETIIGNNSEVTTRCMMCSYKNTNSIRGHFRNPGCLKCSSKCNWYYEIFIYESFLIYGDKFIYPIIEQNKKITTKENFDIICKKNKHVLSVNIMDHIYNKAGCPKCSIEERKWNYDKLMEAVIRIHGYKYNYSKIIPPEINSCDVQLTVSCNTCDYEWYPILYNHINQKSGCPSCAGNAPWTYERFLISAFRIHGNKYYYGLIKSEDIQNKGSKIILWCAKCDYYWETSVTKHYTTDFEGCKSCSKREPWTYIKFIKSTQIVHGDKYSYELVNPDDIKGYESVINVICLTCKYHWSTTVNNHINSKCNCPKCMNCASHTLETLIIKINEIHMDTINYSLIKQEHIRNNRSPLPVICNKCKKCWSPSADSLVNHKRGCPRCKISKGERACLNYLLENNIFFEEQFKIPELGMKRFDFMIENNELKYVVEFDGIQHFKFVEYFHKSVNVFIERQEVDILKTIVALKNGFNIIRIDYKQIDNVNFHISEALRSEQKFYFSTPELYMHIIRKLETI